MSTPPPASPRRASRWPFVRVLLMLFVPVAAVFGIALWRFWAVAHPRRMSPAKTAATTTAVRDELRALAAALERYAPDGYGLPPERRLLTYLEPRDYRDLERAGSVLLGSVEAGRAYFDPGLTTPVAYAPPLAKDPFAPNATLPYAYALRTGAVGYSSKPVEGQAARPREWIVMSAGPNRKYEIDPDRDLEWALSPGEIGTVGVLPAEGATYGFSARAVAARALDGATSQGAGRARIAVPIGLVRQTYDATNGLESSGDIWWLGR